jgi:hypothetical protein
MPFSSEPDNGIAYRNPDVRRFGDSFQVFLGWNDKFDPNNEDDTNTRVWAARGVSSGNIVPWTHSNQKTTLPDKNCLHEYWAKLLGPSDGCSEAGGYFLEYVEELVPNIPHDPFPAWPKKNQLGAEYIRGAAAETDFAPKHLIDGLEKGGLVICARISQLMAGNPRVDNVVHQLRKLEGWAEFQRRTLDRAVTERMLSGTDDFKISEQPSFTLWLDKNPKAKKTYDDHNNEKSGKVGGQTKNTKDNSVQKGKRKNREYEKVDEGRPEPSKKARVKEDGKRERGNREGDDAGLKYALRTEEILGAATGLSESHRSCLRFVMEQKRQIERLGGHWEPEFRFVTPLESETKNS